MAPVTTSAPEPATSPAHRPGRRLARLRRGGTGLTVLLVLASLSVLLPLYQAASMAFKTTEQATEGTGLALPAPPTLASFAEAWELTRFPQSFAVSAMVSFLAVLGVVLLSSMASYAIVRNWDGRFYRWTFYYLLAGMFVPFAVVALPQVKLTHQLGLDNPFGVALMHTTFQLAFSLLLHSAFIRSLPEEIEEAARIDGASTAQIFWRIVFPLLAPMNATVGIFTFLASWNDYMMPSLITANPALQTLPVVQKLFESQFGTDYNVAFASYLLAMAPTILVYVLAQRWVMDSVTRGAVK